MSGPIQESIEAALQETFSPAVLQVINESHMHAVPPGSESHFKVIVVSDAFAEQRMVGRHRAVNSALRAQLDAGLHALSIQAMTPAQWTERGGMVPDSPPCGGASKGS